MIFKTLRRIKVKGIKSFINFVIKSAHVYSIIPIHSNSTHTIAIVHEHVRAVYIYIYIIKLMTINLQIRLNKRISEFNANVQIIAVYHDNYLRK